MNRAKYVNRFRKLLQQRRREILETAKGTHLELTALQNQERDPEYEENAQAELADYTLSSLLESQRRELMMIDAALRRMDEGEFGTCIDCGNEIATERIEALPFAIRCGECASRQEQETRGHHVSASL